MKKLAVRLGLVALVAYIAGLVFINNGRTDFEAE